MKPTIEFEFEFDSDDDFNNWPRFCSTEYHAISAKMHRVLPARSKKVEFESRFASIFLYERRASRRSKRGYVNVNVRYYAVDERGRVKTFRTWRKFLKELERELERNLVVNPVTKLEYKFSQYDSMEVTLYQKFFADEEELIKKCVENYVESKLDGVMEELRMVSTKILLREEKLGWCEGIRENLDEFRNRPSYDALAELLSNYSVKYFESNPNPSNPNPSKPNQSGTEELKLRLEKLREVFKVMKRLRKDIENERARFELMNKGDLKETYRGLLADLKKLSASKREMVDAILDVTNPEYRMAKLQIEELLKVARRLFGECYDELVERVERREREIREKIEELRREEEELRRKIETEKRKLEEFAWAEIRKSIVPVSV